MGQIEAMRARRTDPATSHEAAAMAVQFAPGHQELVLRALREHGQLGAEQIANIIGMQAYAVRKRLPELQDLHLVEPAGDLTRRTATGRRERVWRVA